MTKPRYLMSCTAGSQERGVAASPADYAWIVNFNNGNSNWNNQNNEYHVRAVRAGECRAAVSLRTLHTAWLEARRAKKPSANQLAFDALWIDRLIELQARLSAGTWEPGPATCFIARAPKAREIHAPDFADRVVHHWLVPQLEAVYEPTFIHDVYSNRIGKGTHAAVRRLQAFIREVDSGQGGGWFLQLDIRNFFNAIHRPTLYAMLKRRVERHGIALPARQAAHALLRRSAGKSVIYQCTAIERAAVPAHKRLENAATGCGIPIGNLSSQFFANVYLDALDQFVKHELRAPRYLRYVDDFVLVHQDREQLATWCVRIEAFLAERLRLTLKPAQLKPLSAGVDFLGYVIYPRHAVVRRRVISHARAKLDRWARKHVAGDRVTADEHSREELRSICASYAGHFSHANSWKLRRRFRERYPWLRQAAA